MPGLTANYAITFDLTNDTPDPATVQLQRDYNLNTLSSSAPGVVLLHPGESVSLVLDAGAPYRYCLKTRSHVANVTAQAWRDLRFDMSRVFPDGAGAGHVTPWPPAGLNVPLTLTPGLTVDKLWRDVRFCMWYDA